jgi:hypothetical protein
MDARHPIEGFERSAMTQTPTLYPEEVQIKQTELNFFLYWRKPNGWIVSAPGWPQEYAKRIRARWEALPQYGTFIPGQKATDARGVTFNPHREPWRVIFQHNGADAFPLEQVIAYNWHLNPPYKEVVFPQLEGVTVDIFDCPECNAQPFHEAEHLAQHLRIRHEYSRLDLKIYGEEASIEFVRGRRKKVKERSLETLPSAGDLTPTEVEYGEPCDVEGCDRGDGKPYAPRADSKNPQSAMRLHKWRAHSVKGNLVTSEGVSDGSAEVQQEKQK